MGARKMVRESGSTGAWRVRHRAWRVTSHPSAQCAAPIGAAVAGAGTRAGYDGREPGLPAAPLTRSAPAEIAPPSRCRARPAGTGASVAASVHALCTAAFFVACRAAPFPPGSSAKARALGVCAVATALLGAGACALELRALLEQPREPMTHLAAPLLLAALATAQWHCAAHWCVGGTSAGTAALTCAYAMLPAIPLATLALRGSHAAASAVAAATSSAGATTTAASAAATAAATGAAAGGGGGGGGEDGGGASPPPSELAQALGLPAGLARRGVVSSAGVLLMAMACGCFSYSKERQRRIEAMLGAADLDDVDEPGETAGLVAALTADSE